MSEKTENRDKGIPYLSDIPYLGNLFKSVSKVSSVTETVIFIKATVINSGGGIGNYDRTLHDTFTSSTRPFLNN
jgi:type II secretory pathway component GspD/PulD (secretin)